MSQATQAITLTARWDHDQVLLGKATRRGLLIEIEAPKIEEERRARRAPVNVAVVIDRSGSMQGEPLFAAIEAAVGVTEQLGPEDRLTVVAYDNQVEVPVDALAMDPEGRKRAELAIRGLSARGSTDLAGGWLQGARCVARAMDAHGFEAGHVILLSDGCTNVGIQDPDELARLAADLAERGVTSTCVGIGAHTSLLQLTAIAEAGQGELHQSSEPAEIIEVLAGEIGEQTRIVARNFSVFVAGPAIAQARQLTRYRSMPIGGRQEFFIGNLVAGQKRQLALLVEFPRDLLAVEGEQRFEATGSWLDPESALEELKATTRFTLDVAPEGRFDPEGKDERVTEIIATLWLARQGYEAMMFNERGDYAAAARSLDEERADFEELVENMKFESAMLSSHKQVRSRTQARWDGLSKREAMMLARKRMRAKPDFRAAHEGREWTEVEAE